MRTGVLVRGLAVFVVVSAWQSASANWNWTGPSGGNWGNPNNWDPASVPDASGSASVPAGIAVQVTAAAACGGLYLDRGATLTVAATGSLVINGYSPLYGLLDNYGTVTWTNGDINPYNDGATFTGNIRNRAGALWDIQCDSRWIGSFISGSHESFVNEGALRKSAGAGASWVVSPLIQSGTVDVQAGTLYVSAGGELAGVLSATAGAVLRFNSGVFELGAATFAGDVEFTDGTCVLTVDMVDEVTVNGAVVEGTLAGTLNLGTSGVVQGTSLTVAGGAILNIDGGVYLYGPLVNEGTVHWRAGAVSVYSDEATYKGVISNRYGAVWDIQCDNYGLSGSAGFERFVNEGTLRKSAGAGFTYVGLPLVQQGQTDVQAGTLQCSAGGELVGDVSAGAGAAIRFNGGVYELGAATFSGDVVFSGGTCILTADMADDVTVNGANVKGTLAGTAQILSGGLANGTSLTVASGATLNIDGGMHVYGPLVNEGTVHWNAGHVTVYNDETTYTGVVSNRSGAVWDIRCDYQSIQGGYNTERFVNEGTLRKSAGANASNVGVRLIHSGLVDAQSGTIHCGGGGELTGDVSADASAAVRFSGGTFLVGNADFTGDIQFTSGTCVLSAGMVDEVTVNGAYVEGTVAGTLHLLGGGLNTGAMLTVAAGGRLNLLGGSLQPGSTMTVEVDGVLNIDGTAHLSGALVSEGTVNCLGGALHLYNDGGTYTGAISNRIGAVCDIQCDGFRVYQGWGVGSQHFVNEGTLRKSVGEGESYVAVRLVHTGLVDVQAGALLFQAGGEPDGQVVAATDAMVRFDGGTFLVDAADFTGDVLFTAGTCMLGESMVDEVTVDGANVEGTLAGRLRILRGNVAQGSTLAVTVDGELTIDGHTNLSGALVNEGEVRWIGGDVRVYNDGATYTGVVSNRVGAVWDIQCDGQSVFWWSGVERFMNEGTLRKSAGAGDTHLFIPLIQSGMVDVQAGTLYMQAGGELGGSVAAASGAAVRFANGTFDVGAAAFSGDVQFTGGTVDIGRGLFTGDVGFRGGTCQMDGDLAREIAIDGANLFVSGALTGTVSFLSGGLLPPGAALTIAPAGVVNIGGSASLYGPLINDGTVHWTDGGIGVYNDGGTYFGVISNRVGGVWDVQCDGQSVSWYWGLERFVNEGTLRKSAGAGNAVFNINFVNAGTVEARTGAIRLPNAPDLQDGMLRSMLAGDAPAGYTYVAGATTLDGRVGAFLADGFRPYSGDSFVLVRHDGLSGSFDGTDLPADVAWDTELDSSAFTITALNNAPEIAPIEDQETDEQVPFSFSIPGCDWDMANPRLIGVSIPTNSMDASCHPLSEEPDVWTIQAPPLPFDTASGIGYLVSPEPITQVTLHDHVYADSYVPDPSRAVVTYEFEAPVTVAGIEVVQHSNGITEIEGFAGDSLESLTSVGSVYSPAGQRTFTEGETSIFTFTAPAPGKYFRFVIRRTSLEDGYAAYRAYPLKAGNARIAPAYAPRNALAYSLLSGPVGASVDPDTGLFSWTPTEAQGPGFYGVEVVIGDGGSPELFATNSFSITVAEVNVAPVLGAIGNRNLHALEPLAVQAMATDTDLPANTLSFELVSGPSGLSVSPAGAVTWSPTEDDLGAHEVRVKVGDDAVPGLSDEEVFTVTISPECRIQEIAVTSGVVSVSWNSIAGRRYMLRTSPVPDLDPGSWEDVPPAVEASGPDASAPASPEVDSHFYRIQMLP